MKIRKAKPEEWKDIQRLNKQIFDYELKIVPSSNCDFPNTQEAIDYFKLAANEKNDHVAFIYELNQRVVGYAISKIIPASELTHRLGVKLGQLHTLCVDKEHRYGGIGKQLIEESKKWALLKGASHFKIVAYADNAPARHLYKKCGFTEFEVGYELKLTE